MRPEPLSRALETRENRRKCAAAPGPKTWARSRRWQAARSTWPSLAGCGAGLRPRRRGLGGVADHLGAADGATTRFWLTGPTAVQVPSGVTGDSSIPVNSGGSNCHSRASTAATRRGSHAAGRTNLSCCQRRITSAGVTWSARPGPRRSAASAGRWAAGRVSVPPGCRRAWPARPVPRPGLRFRHLATVADARPSGKWFAAMPFKSHAARMRIHTVQRRDWRGLQGYQARRAHRRTERLRLDLAGGGIGPRRRSGSNELQRSEDGETLTIVIAADDAGRWDGPRGRLPARRPGSRCRADFDVGCSGLPPTPRSAPN